MTDNAQLIPFDLRSPCPKCEGRGMNGQYCTSAHAGQIRLEAHGEYAQEHLDLVCQWCSYVRFMLTADAQVTQLRERQVGAAEPG